MVSICCGSFQTLPFGNAAALQPGDEVVAIGYALGLPGQATVTRGIVSAVRYDSTHRSDVIQTDAAINPGNSGGPLLSLSGEILGINTFRYDESQSGRPTEGLGFAISGTTVQQQIPTLRAGTPAPTPTPTRRPTATPVPGQTSDFGPTSGELRHDPSDNAIETRVRQRFHCRHDSGRPHLLTRTRQLLTNGTTGSSFAIKGMTRPRFIHPSRSYQRPALGSCVEGNIRPPITNVWAEGLSQRSTPAPGAGTT